MEKEIIIALVIGSFLYFAFEFKTKVKEGFSFKKWIADNWYNLLLTPAVLYAYVTYLHPATVAAEAFMVGFTVNKIIDYFSDLFTKNK